MPQFTCCARTSAVSGDGWLGAQVVDVLARDETGLVASARCRDGRWGCVKMTGRAASACFASTSWAPSCVSKSPSAALRLPDSPPSVASSRVTQP